MSSPSVFIAVHAGSWEIIDFRMWKGFSVGYLIKLHPGYATFLVGFIIPKSDIIFYSAGDHTRPAARAFVKVNYHPVFVSMSLFLFHNLPHLYALISLTGVFHHTG